MGADSQPRSSFCSPARDYIPGVSADFNPRAVQNAAQNPPPRKQLPTGPFIDAVPAGKYHIAAGMSMETHLQRQAHIQLARRTVKALKAARWIMLPCRVLQLVAALGLVVLLISLRGMDDLNGYIMRVPPAVAIVHVLYAIYHNARDPKDRPPQSSANYALFAAASDCCFIPFYVFIAMWSWQQHQQMLADPMNKENWVTVFNKNDLDLNQLIVFIVFCVSCAGGGLMAFTLCLGLFIAVVFRRISHLPPDMNPLDKSTYTSLTARPSSKRFSKSSNNSDESLEKTVSRDVSPTRRAVPFLEVRTKNGSLSWEYTQDADRAKSNIDLPDLIPSASASNTAPLLPPPHRFSEFGGDSRRNSVDTTRSHPNSPNRHQNHRKNNSIGYYSDREQSSQNDPSTPPRPPRHAYKQRPAEWWTVANNFPSAFPAFPGSGGSSSGTRYSAISQADSDAVSFGDGRASRNTFGQAPSHPVGRPGTPPNIPSYAGSIYTASAPSVSSGPTGVRPAHMSTPPGVSAPTVTLGAFASDLAPRPLSFANNRSAPGSPRQSAPAPHQGHQHRNSVGRLPYGRADAASSAGSSPNRGGNTNGVLGSYTRPPPQTSLTPPAMSPTKGGVFGGRAVDGAGGNVYTRDGMMTPAGSEPSSPVKGQRPKTPGSTVRDKRSKYETLSQDSPGRSTSGEKRKSARAKVKRDDKERRKSARRLEAEEGEKEREKEASTRVVSNSGADFAHMFGGGMRGRVISGSQVV